jgi:phenylalanine-4-hydroxylase
MMQYPQATKHGLAAGEAGYPARADWTIDQSWERYTFEEHAVWKRLYERQTKLLPGRACDDCQQSYFVLGILDELLGLARIDFAPLYDRVKGQPDYEPGAVLLIGRLVARGSGAYHAARRGH